MTEMNMDELKKDLAELDSMSRGGYFAQHLEGKYGSSIAELRHLLRAYRQERTLERCKELKEVTD